MKKADVSAKTCPNLKLKSIVLHLETIIVNECIRLCLIDPYSSVIFLSFLNQSGRRNSSAITNSASFYHANLKLKLPCLLCV